MRGVVGCAHASSGQPCGPRRLFGSDFGTTGWGRSAHRPLARIDTFARAGRSRAKRRPASLADTARADSSQRSAEQLEAGTTSSEITTAVRFWWNSITTGCRTKMKLSSRGGTAQHNTLSKRRHSTTMMCDICARQAVLGPNPSAMAWNQRCSDHFQRFAAAKII